MSGATIVVASPESGEVAAAPVLDMEAVAEATVEVAEIEADRDVAIAEIQADVSAAAIDASASESETVASLRAELSDMRGRLESLEAGAIRQAEITSAVIDAVTEPVEEEAAPAEGGEEEAPPATDNTPKRKRHFA